VDIQVSPLAGAGGCLRGQVIQNVLGEQLHLAWYTMRGAAIVNGCSSEAFFELPSQVRVQWMLLP